MDLLSKYCFRELLKINIHGTNFVLANISSKSSKIILQKYMWDCYISSSYQI